MKRLKILAAIVCVLTLTLAGCGEVESPSSPDRAIAANDLSEPDTTTATTTAVTETTTTEIITTTTEKSTTTTEETTTTTEETTTTTATTTTTTTKATTTTTAKQAVKQLWILNTNTMKFHEPGCTSVGKIKPENYLEFKGTYQQCKDKGYDPCGVCKPRP